MSSKNKDGVLYLFFFLRIFILCYLWDKVERIVKLILGLQLKENRPVNIGSQRDVFFLQILTKTNPKGWPVMHFSKHDSWEVINQSTKTSF
jgi:hypothetical protein